MIIKNLKLKLISTLLIITLLLSCLIALPAMAVTSYPLPPDDDKVIDALDYLRGQQATDGSIGDFATSAWVVMAIAAAGGIIGGSPAPFAPRFVAMGSGGPTQLGSMFGMSSAVGIL